MTVVLFGARGTLGSELVAQFPATLGTLHAFGHAEADITNESQMTEALARLKPRIIINAAAYNAVDQAEDDPLAAFRANSIAPATLAWLAHKHQAVLMHYSTDFVFDGREPLPSTEESPTNPLSIYGKSKLLGETAALTIHPQSYVLRTASVFGKRGANFLTRFLAMAEQHENLKMTNDMIGTPTAAADLARATFAILQQRIPFGLYHAAGASSCTRFEWACGIAQHLKLKNKIEAISSAAFAAKAARPHYSMMSSAKLAQHGITLQSWQDALHEIFPPSRSSHA